MASKTKIIIVDDHDIFRMGLKSYINESPFMSVVGEAGNANALFKLLEAVQCDLIILDLSLPGLDGYAILERLNQKSQCVRKLIVTAFEDLASAKRALDFGIEGFATKRNIGANIVQAIQPIANGRKYFSDDIKELILSNYDTITRRAEEADRLTQREVEVARLISTGASSQKIADALNISIHTVRFHKGNIKKKLDLENTVEIVKYVLKNLI